MKTLQSKLLELGSASLTDVEILSILVGDEKAAYSISEKVGGSLKELGKLYSSELLHLPGVTKARGLRMIASLEFARRKAIEHTIEKKTVHTSNDIAKFVMEKIGDLPHEVFFCLFLNRANKIIHHEIVSSGGYTGTVADPKMILRIALERKAINIVLAHNHPSGSLKPSRADELLTKKIKDGAALLDINVLDHVIVTSDGYYSFADEGII